MLIIAVYEVSNIDLYCQHILIHRYFHLSYKLLQVIPKIYLKSRGEGKGTSSAKTKRNKIDHANNFIRVKVNKIIKLKLNTTPVHNHLYVQNYVENDKKLESCYKHRKADNEDFLSRLKNKSRAYSNNTDHTHS